MRPWIFFEFARRLIPAGMIILAFSCVAMSPLPDPDKICPNDEEESASPLALSITTEYDNKYMFRGVNSLAGSGIGTFDTELSYALDKERPDDAFSLEVWHATGISKTFEELDFTASYTWSPKQCKSLTFSGGYVNYFIPNDDHLDLGYRDTSEIFGSVEYDFSCFTATLKYSYDFDKIRGGFIESKFAACLPAAPLGIAFDPYVSLNYDMQYNSSRFAWNNFQAGVEIVRKINDTLKVTAVGEVSVPLAAINDFAKKEGWIGLRLTADF